MFSRKNVFKFPQALLDKPIISKLVKDFNLDFNILRASVTPNEEGILVLELIGDSKDYKKGIDYLKGLGVIIQPLSQDIKRNEKRCTHCGACIIICPTEALVVDKKTRKVSFFNDKCIACELCIPACPPRAMEVHY